MSSLWKRANPRQVKVLRIIAGAVLNAAHAHPGKLPDKVFARSVAKRAVGTLSAEWAGVLAAPYQRPSDGSTEQITNRSTTSGGQVANRRGRARLRKRDLPSGSEINEARVLRKTHVTLGRLASVYRRQGPADRYEDILAALRAVGVLLKSEAAE
jgi:hypothetical protein